MMKPDYLTSPTVWTILSGCFLLTLLMTPLIMRFAPRIGAVDHGGHRCVYQGKPMPLLGGLAIAVPFVMICLLGAVKISFMFGTIKHHRAGLIALAVGCAGICILGVIDDMKGLGARAKFIVQIALAWLALAAGYSINALDLPFVGHVPLGPVAGAALTILWIVGLTNAYNLMDGIDGLSAGLALIAAAGLASISLLNGSTFPALMCIALVGSLSAFLLFNFHPARIFLGDTGSMFLGFALANITLMGSLKTTGAVMFLAPVLVMGLPIMDTLSSMLRRYLRGRPLFYGDQGHIHHRLLKRGYSQREVALTFYAIAALMTVSAVVGWAFPKDSAIKWLAYASYALAAAGVIWIAGLWPTMLVQMVGARKRNLLLNAFSRYAALSLDILPREGSANTDNILLILCRELHLKFIQVADGSARKIVSFGEQSCGSDQVARIQVHNAGHQQFELSYQTEAPVDEQARADIESCLAMIFENAHFGSAPAPKPRPKRHRPRFEPRTTL
ncbi:undecaprenyl/decaprenyl-phosphate alpha-N-acetylglucosaminyl 1-phosphate transferase [bacterium]|nr:undecaprenyl/decaprenyl-phosphate alpha-N-acetylglucosaminyl 1-phosphate transferase [bacterium]